MLRLYKCNYNDAKFLFKIRNDSETRKNSFSQKKIKYADHIHWLKLKLKDINCRIYILKKNNIKIGQIRFDLTNNKIEIDFGIVNDYRNKGYGKILLSKGIKLKYLQNYKIIEKIIKDNKSSLKIFEKLKFKKSYRKGYFIFYK